MEGRCNASGFEDNGGDHELNLSGPEKLEKNQSLS